MNKSLFIVLLTIAILFTACSGQNTFGDSVPAESLVSGVQSEISAVSESQVTEGTSVRELLMRDKPGTINAIVYMDTNSVWLKGSYSDLELDAHEPELIEKYETALDKVRINEASMETLLDQPDLAQFSEFLDFEVPFGEGNEYIEHIITLPDGTVFLSEFYAGSDTKYYRCKMTDASQYAALRADMDAIKTEWESNVEYSLYVGISPDGFKPESQVLRIRLINKGSYPVSFGRDFKIERTDSGTGTPLSYTIPFTDDLVIVAPGEDTIYTIDLNALENGRAEGSYRISQTFHNEKGSVEIQKEYAIGEEFDEVSYPVPPKMTPENQDYYNKYLRVWGLENPFQNDFSEQNPPKDFEPFLLYGGCARLEFEGDMEKYSESRPFPDIPATQVEAVIARHFPVTAEQFRVEVERMGVERMSYDPQKDVYHFEGGYGGVGVYGVVTNSSREGDLITLDCDWYGGWGDSPVFSNKVTIRLGEKKNDFFYLSNVVTAEVR